MDKILAIYKPAGMTPLQVIKKLRSKHSEYRNLKIGYAGRLDPLAHGLMLLTVGEENKNRQQYLNLNKTYKFSVLFGIATDSYDYLGLPLSEEILTPPTQLDKKITGFIKTHKGTLTQTYPPFSSKTVNGIPLYKLAKKTGFNSANLPTRQIEIFDFSLELIEYIPSREVKLIILDNLKKIRGHFRQKKVIALWEELFKLNPTHQFKLATFILECSSGTYVRSLANKMGMEFGCGAIAFEILRTKVGDYTLKDCIEII